MGTTEKVHGTGNFVFDSVRIVDYDATNNNVLVRGSAAFGGKYKNKPFKFSDLVSAVQADANYGEIGFNVSDSFVVFDFCLIGYGPSNTKDKNIVAAEAEWFGGSGSQLNGLYAPGVSYPEIITDGSDGNQMIFWPVQALGPGCPTTTGGHWTNTADVNNTMNTDGYRFKDLPDSLHYVLTNQASKVPNLGSPDIKNAIIYVHCDSGINRTGAAVISYFTKYGSKIQQYGVPNEDNTLAEGQTAAQQNQPEGNMPVGGVDQGIAEAYCNYTYSDGNALAKLNANCVPLSGTVNS